jgi:hypothetical protein
VLLRPYLRQRRYALNGRKVGRDIVTLVPELAALPGYYHHADHVWLETPIVKKIFLHIIHVSARPTYVERRGPETAPTFTMVLTYEVTTMKLSHRLLPRIQTDAIHIAYLGDKIWIYQKKQTQARLSHADRGDIWVMEPFSGPEGIELRKSEILDVLKLQSVSFEEDDFGTDEGGTRRNNLALAAFNRLGTLLADAKSGMIVRMDKDNRMWFFSFWSTPCFYCDRNRERQQHVRFPCARSGGHKSRVAGS